MATQPARLYVDAMSQPCRAVMMFCKMNNIPMELKQVLIHKGQARSAEYLQVNPLGKVPFLEDGDVRLPESAAILMYLASKHTVPEHWYPRSCLKQRAVVDAALHWYHGMVRAGCTRLVFNKVLATRMGQVPNEEVANDGLNITRTSLRALESYWLKGRPFMTGDRVGGQVFEGGGWFRWLNGHAFMTGDQVSLPDILCACEFEQLMMMDKSQHGTDLEDLLQNHPVVRQWLTRVAEACSPHYEEAHSMLRRAVKGAKGRAKM